MALTYSKGKWISALSLSLLCAASISGCSKKDKDAETTAESDVAAETQAAATAPSNQLPCDDPAIVNNLSRSIKGLIAQQARNEVSKYATQVGTSFDMTAVNSAMNDIIVDFGSAKTLDANDANGMQTCQASLSLTLPSENIYLANEVYNGLDGKSMQQTLTAANVRLSNNMLVDDAFTYVVGMQGGQAVAKVAGQPAIIKAVADIMAKSQLKEMMETNAAHPVVPVTPRPPAEPRVQDDTVRQNRQSSNSTSSTNSSIRSEEVENTRKPTTSTTNDEAHNAILSTPKLSEELKVPTDESVEMVIVEEDATY